MEKNKKHVKLGYVKLSKDRIKLFFDSGEGDYAEFYLYLNINDPVMGKGYMAGLWFNPGQSNGIASLLVKLVEMRLEDQKNFPKRS